jgi:hypothetical protein
MIIVIKEKDKVYFAIGAWGTSDCLSMQDALHEDNLPIWRVQGVPKCLMAVTGTSALGYDLLRYKDFGLRAALTPTNLITKIVPTMKNTLVEFEQLDKDGDNWGSILIAKGGKAYHLSCDFTYEEIEESLALGRESTVGRGALRLTRGMPAIERIRKIMQVMETTYKYKQFPAVVMSTDGERTVLYE